MIPLIVYIYQSDYLLSSNGVVLTQPASVSVRQEVVVVPLLYSPPPQTVFFSWVWKCLFTGRSGS